MAILLTGGAGFIGSHIAVDLIEAGENIVIVDNFTNSSPETIENIKKITGKDFTSYTMDVRDRNNLARVFAENNIEAVIHLAGLKAVGESVEKPILYYDNNLVSTLVLCELMEKFGVKKFVFSSSATVYGLAKEMPLNESTPTSCLNPYGNTKLFAEQILTDWQAAKPDISVINLRYFNPIGGHLSGLLGEDPDGPPKNLVPYVARVVSGVYPSVKVFGDDYDTPDGTGIRDYIHMLDLSRGHILALDYARKHSGTHTFNLGTGAGYSVLDIIKTFEKITGEPLPYTIEARRPGDADASYADPSLAKAELGFEAKFGLEDMCRDSLKFVMKKKD